MLHCPYRRRPLPPLVRSQLDEAAFLQFSAPEHWHDVAQEHGETIFQEIMFHLIRVDFSIAEARLHFERILQHFHALKRMLGRPVGLRTAACDYFLHAEPTLHEPVLVESYQLHRHEEEAMLDELTCMPNRRAFQRELDREVKRYQRSNRPFSLLMIDVDHFKRVNDQHGHSVGDTVLQHISRQLTDTLRCMDFAARFGGEEFVIILPETDASEAMRAAERFRLAVANASTPVGHMTVSIGSASYPQDAVTQDAMVVAADRALYKAKHLGRNRVALAGLEMRRFPRMPIQIPASCRPMEQDANTISGGTVNVSKGGILLESTSPILPQRMVLVFLEVPEQSFPLAIAASPVHQVLLSNASPPVSKGGNGGKNNGLADASPPTYQTGMRFLGMDDNTTHTLHSLLGINTAMH